jgi:CBS domain containing-hemolysin-like protein
VFLVSCSAFFSSAETAITSLAHGRLRYLVNAHPKKKKGLTHLLEEPNDLITALLVLNNLVNVMASSLMTLVVIQVLPTHSASLQGLVATAVMTISLLIFGEITPKNFAKHNAERLTLATINQIYQMTRLLRPIIFVFRNIASGIGKAFGVDLSEMEQIEVSDEQIETLISDGEQSGLLDEADGDMIRRILDFDEMTAEQVMIPRPDVQTIEVDTSIEDVRDIVSKDGHSRFPVYHEDPDNIVGTLYAKDLLSARAAEPDLTLRELLRPAYYAPTTQPINQLLREFQRQKVHMAVVIDEFGGFDGIVTIEDILEEIVGEIEDEYDRPTSLLIRRLSPDEALIAGDTAVHDLNRTMSIELPEDEGVTVNGLIQHRLGTMAKAGDQVEIGGVSFRVERATDREITSVRILIDRSADTDESES